MKCEKRAYSGTQRQSRTFDIGVSILVSRSLRYTSFTFRPVCPRCLYDMFVLDQSTIACSAATSCGWVSELILLASARWLIFEEKIIMRAAFVVVLAHSLSVWGNSFTPPLQLHPCAANAESQLWCVLLFLFFSFCGNGFTCSRLVL